MRTVVYRTGSRKPACWIFGVDFVDFGGAVFSFVAT